ncbi:MAG TPA: class I SAM-dependent methyltransferase [Spirochaetales bacterium]|nr:class I SAM-dependent methyltransferase [Spirochaetales bacterium]
MHCRACASSFRAATPWTRARGVAWFRCPRCGQVRVEPSAVPGPEAAAARYRLHRNDPAEPGYRAFLETFVDRALAPFAAPPARVLDFGSGPAPALALLLRERGYDAEAWDPLFAPDRRALTGPFVLVAVHEVLEHVPYPYRLLSTLARKLAPGGSIAVRTRFPPERPEDFARWWYKEDPTHIGFFGPLAFEALSRRLGADLALLEAPDLAVLRFSAEAGQAGRCRAGSDDPLRDCP